MVTLATPQLSLVTGVPKAITAEHKPASFAVLISPGQVIFGISLSTTVTVWVLIVVLDEGSVAVHTIVVAATGNCTALTCNGATGSIETVDNPS